jgi:hypothetical protein
VTRHHTGDPEEGKLADWPVGDRTLPRWFWWPAFVVIQYAALAVAFVFDPAGFDRCEAVPSDGAKLAQVLVAGVAVAGSVALAIWRLRAWHLVAALLAVVVAALAWVLLLGGSQSCALPG